MRHSRRTSLSLIGVAALTLGVLLSGCGGPSTTHTGHAAVTNTPTPWPTAAATATTSSAAIPESAGCPPVSEPPPQPQYVAVGALNVSVPERLHDYPSELMPNNAPNAPYQVPLTATEAQQAGAFHPNPPVNPTLSNGYHLQICNETTASQTLTSLSVTIASFTPSSGPVTVWHICGDGPYDTATKHTTSGCGGATGGVDYLAATLPSDSTGASAPAIANGRMSVGSIPIGVDLPVSIGPNKSIELLVAVNGLTSQGTYALSFSISVDGAAPTTLTPSDGPFLIAPSAVVWTGTACQTPAMQAQIPPSSQDIYYVCPPAA
jgi:hypothetical protein